MRINENGSDGTKGCADQDYCDKAQRKSDEEREARKNRGAKVDALQDNATCGDPDVGCEIFLGADVAVLHYYGEYTAIDMSTLTDAELIALQGFMDNAEARTSAITAGEAAQIGLYQSTGATLFTAGIIAYIWNFIRFGLPVGEIEKM